MQTKYVIPGLILTLTIVGQILAAERHIDNPASMSGRVVSDQGDPVETARVWLRHGPPGDQHFVSTLTDADGRFRIPEVQPGGAASLVALKKGLSIGGLGILSIQSGQILTDLQIELTQPQVLRLRVADERGEPIAGAELSSIYCKPGDADGFQIPLEVFRRERVLPLPRSDNQGELQVSGIPGGCTYHLQIKHADFARRTLENVTPDGKEATAVSLRRGVAVQVRAVTTDGKPLQGATVRTTIGDYEGKRTPIFYGDEPVDAQGKYRIRVDSIPAASEYVLVDVSHPGFISVDGSRKSWSGIPLEFVMARKARVRGRVVDGSGTGLAGVRVGMYRAGVLVARGLTDADGVYKTVGPEGTVQLKARTGVGYEAVDGDSVSVTLFAHRPTDAADLLAKPLPSIRGTVILPSGKPAAHALVICMSNSRETALADAEGRFELPLRWKPRRFSEVIAGDMSSRLSGGTTIHLDAILEGEELRIRLQPESTIHGKVVGEDGKPKGGVTVTLQTRAVCEGRLRVYNAGTCGTSDKGEFRFPGLSRHASYRVEAGEGQQYSAPVGATIDGVPTDFVSLDGEEFRLDLLSVPDSKLIPVPHSQGQPAEELDCGAWMNSPPLSLERLRGKVVLLDFWATWCGPCVKELPQIQMVHEKFADKGLMIIGVHHNSVPVDQVRRFVESRKISFPIAMDSASGETTRRYNVSAWPTKVLIGRDGEIISTINGKASLISAIRKEVLYGALGEE